MSEADTAPEFLFKLVLAGSSGAGKTSLLLRYVDDVFSTNFIATIGVDFKIKTEDVSDTKVKLQMWDTAGQDRFRSIASNFYRCADAVIVVFDVTDMRSLADAETWLAEARRYGPPQCKSLLVGNKVDCEGRLVTEKEAKAFAERLGSSYLETSAKTGQNVREAFTTLAETLVAKRREQGGGYFPGHVGEDAAKDAPLRLGRGTVPLRESWCFGGSFCSMV